ncbi:MAG: methyltransferase domain-containing protein [Planctomycetota bacterium]|nr:methyltransferase domain-containing protein [Planctomycetota bacterium]
MNHYRSLCTMCGLFLLSLVSANASDGPARIEKAMLGETRNVHQCGKLYLAGQPKRGDLARIKAQGIKRIVTLRQDTELDWDQAAAARDLGLEFIKVPFRAPNTLTDEVFDKVRTLLRDTANTPTLLHCGSANRVGAVWLTFRVLDQKVPLATALLEARKIGLTTVAYERRATAYVTAKSKAPSTPREQSVRPGINKGFLDPNLDVQAWLARFEVESREVYKNRQAVLAALHLKPETRVADVGAGTGFFAAAMADQLPAGWVYAVDIAPRFVSYLSQVAARAKHQNMTPILGGENAVRLAPGSIDLAFVCDTYHHFEFPAATLASIHRALRPRGALVVIDFERIPGKSRPFVLNHVRAGKPIFRSEIEAAGFVLAEEVQVTGLKENYFLRFIRR